jgi:hypothetical protein
MKQMTATAVEQVMKLQDVMLRAMAQGDHLVSGSGDPGD